jgi:5-methylcytosine-specific restriction endonuclease McrA
MSSFSRDRRPSPLFDSVAGGEAPADEAHVRREKAAGRELRQSQWWKNLRGRGRCHYCHRGISPRELTMDHIVPLSRGGTSSRSNVVPCCKGCNSRKKHLLPVEWQAYLDELGRRADHA